MRSHRDKNTWQLLVLRYGSLLLFNEITGSSGSKYEHWRASALLRNIRNVRICMGKKPIVSVTYENERISIKYSLPYLKCVLRLLCSPRTDLLPFYGFLCKRFSLRISRGTQRPFSVTYLFGEANIAKNCYMTEAFPISPLLFSEV